MTHGINPSPSQCPEVKRPPRSQVYLSRIFENWILFVIGTLFDITIVTFDLATDWLLLQVLSSSWIHNHVETGSSSTPTQTLVTQLPFLLLAFVSMATIVYGCHVVNIGVQFWLCRIRYQSKVDGVAPDISTVGKCVADLFIMAQLLIENLPLMSILFCLQFYMNCDFYFIIYDNPVVILAVVSTCVSVIWNFSRTIWNWGCLGLRESHHGGTGPRVVRFVNCTLLCITFCLVILNLFLAVPVEKLTNFKMTPLNDKRVLDNWSSLDSIVFTIATDEYIPSVYVGNSKRSNNLTYYYNQTTYAGYHNILAVREVYIHGRINAQIHLDDNQSEWVESFSLLTNYSSDDNELQANRCTVVFTFQSRLFRNEILYNVGFRCSSAQSNEHCFLHPMTARLVTSYENQTEELPVLSDNELIIDYSDTPPSTMEYISHNSPTPDINIPTELRIIRPHVTLSLSLLREQQSLPCDIHFVRNSSLSLPQNICY